MHRVDAVYQCLASNYADPVPRLPLELWLSAWAFILMAAGDGNSSMYDERQRLGRGAPATAPLSVWQGVPRPRPDARKRFVQKKARRAHKRVKGQFGVGGNFGVPHPFWHQIQARPARA
jgi:hypothetical protein